MPQGLDLGTPVPVDYSDAVVRAQEQVEPLAVTIEAIRGDEAPSVGAGLVVGRSDSEFEILTSAELVRPIPSGAAAGRYRVRLAGAEEWVEALPDSIRVRESGVALLRVPSAAAPRAGEIDLDRILPAVTASARIDAPAFVLTLDAAGEPKWYEGRIRTNEEGMLDIHVADAGPELIGAAVLSRNFEYMAQGLDVEGDRLKALHYDALGKEAGTDDVLFAIEPDVVHQTMVRTLQGQRFATLAVRTVNDQGRVYYDWYVLRFRGQDGLFFTGDLWGLERRGRFELDWSRDGLAITFGYMDTPIRKAPDYRMLEEQPLDGFLLFGASGPRVQAWLAIPTGEDQLLGTLLHTSRTRRDGHNFLDRHAKRVLSAYAGGPRMVEVEGNEPLFPLLIPFESEGPAVSLRLPQELTEAGGRIEGTYGLTDIREEGKRRGRARTLDYELSFRDPDKEEPLGSFRFAEDAYRLPFSVKIPAGTTAIEWSMSGRRTGSALAELELAVVRFD